MKPTFAPVLCAGLTFLYAMPTFSAPPLPADTQAMSQSRFDGTRASLERYECPVWFRDAKFGIWSHWGPQAVPMRGDWYARNMYIQGSGQNRSHVERYGPPSKFGYKDIIPLWKAEKWNPDQLMDLYVKAGAKYFVSMGVHHDNFDLWNSKYHQWNAVQMGPKRDILGEWQRAARKRGLRFGVSEHLGASYTWFQTSHGSDQTGPLAGVPYDGADPKHQELYHAPDTSFNGDLRTWYTSNPAAQREWDARIRNLLDSYHPDLLYTDGGIPFGEVGRNLIAHFYNSNRDRHSGQLEAVYNHKDIGSGEFITKAGVQDVERGVLEGINPLPWQTDTSTGDWFYSENDRYKTTADVIHLLCDIVSKNGNLLLNVVQRPDGSLPSESLKIVQELGEWMPANGEAIFGTRPWAVYGEGQITPAGLFQESRQTYTPSDIRFTRKGDTLYAIMLAWPQAEAGQPAKAVIKALASDSPFVTGSQFKVQLLGSKASVRFQRTRNGLEVALPVQAPTQHAVVFKITGLKTLSDIAPPTLAQWNKRLFPALDKSVTASADGSLLLSPDKAELHGGIRVQGEGQTRNLGYWNNPSGFISWNEVQVAAPGTYRIEVQGATIHPASNIIIDVNGQKLPTRMASTGGWEIFQSVSVSTVDLKIPATISVKITAVADGWHPVNIRAIRLVKVTSQ